MVDHIKRAAADATGRSQDGDVGHSVTHKQGDFVSITVRAGNPFGTGTNRLQKMVAKVVRRNNPKSTVCETSLDRFATISWGPGLWGRRALIGHRGGILEMCIFTDKIVFPSWSGITGR